MYITSLFCLIGIAHYEMSIKIKRQPRCVDPCNIPLYLMRSGCYTNGVRGHKTR